MQLNRFTDYALRVMMHLAAANGRLMSTREIADLHEAKYNHLAKVTQWLANEGYIETIRVRSGGVLDQVTLADVLKRQSGMFDLLISMNAK